MCFKLDVEWVFFEMVKNMIENCWVEELNKRLMVSNLIIILEEIEVILIY